MRASMFIGMAAVLLLGGCAEENFNTQGGAFVPMGSAISAPSGYQDMCSGPRASLCHTERPQYAHLDVDSLHVRRAPVAMRSVAIGVPMTSAWPGLAASSSVAGTQDLGTSDGLLYLLVKSGRFQAAAYVDSALSADVSGALAPSASNLTASSAPLTLTSMTTPTQVTAPALGAAGPAGAVPSDPAEVVVRAKRPLSERLAQLDQINRYVNAHTRQVTDLEHYGVVEFWTRAGSGPDAAGDCEDIAIEKRWELIDRGFPREDLFYAEVYREDIGLHVVLVAHTEDGDYVLDCRSMQLTPWNRTAYYWIKRQAPDDETKWVAVDSTSSSRPSVLVAAEAEHAGTAALASRSLSQR